MPQKKGQTNIEVSGTTAVAGKKKAPPQPQPPSQEQYGSTSEVHAKTKVAEQCGTNSEDPGKTETAVAGTKALSLNFQSWDFQGRS